MDRIIFRSSGLLPKLGYSQQSAHSSISSHHTQQSLPLLLVLIFRSEPEVSGSGWRYVCEKEKGVRVVAMVAALVTTEWVAKGFPHLQV